MEEEAARKALIEQNRLKNLEKARIALQIRKEVERNLNLAQKPPETPQPPPVETHTYKPITIEEKKPLKRTRVREEEHSEDDEPAWRKKKIKLPTAEIFREKPPSFIDTAIRFGIGVAAPLIISAVVKHFNENGKTFNSNSTGKGNHSNGGDEWFSLDAK